MLEKKFIFFSDTYPLHVRLLLRIHRKDVVQSRGHGREVLRRELARAPHVRVPAGRLLPDVHAQVGRVRAARPGRRVVGQKLLVILAVKVAAVRVLHHVHLRVQGLTPVLALPVDGNVEFLLEACVQRVLLVDGRVWIDLLRLDLGRWYGHDGVVDVGHRLRKTDRKTEL